MTPNPHPQEKVSFPAQNLSKPKSKSQKMTYQASEAILQEDERDCLSDSHRDYMIRYCEFEILRQQRVSERFLQERFKRLAAVQPIEQAN
jgi:hypothetical protein